MSIAYFQASNRDAKQGNAHEYIVLQVAIAPNNIEPPIRSIGRVA